MNYPPSIQKLIDLFSKFPTVGPRTASRFVFYLMRKKKEEIVELLAVISELKQNIKTCSFCFNPYESEGELCPICSSPLRDKTLLCLVASETDLATIEKTKKYRGLYFIFEKLRVRELAERIKSRLEIQEIILAFNSTSEGEATALSLERLLKPLRKKITRLGRGLPVGGELEYADEETLSSALEGRK